MISAFPLSDCITFPRKPFSKIPCPQNLVSQNLLFTRISSLSICIIPQRYVVWSKKYEFVIFFLHSLGTNSRMTKRRKDKISKYKRTKGRNLFTWWETFPLNKRLWSLNFCSSTFCSSVLSAFSHKFLLHIITIYPYSSQI